MLKKRIKTPDPVKFERELKLALNAGWTLVDGPKWCHGPHGTYKMAFFRKEDRQCARRND